jgi:predicted RecA/RadA family phage recombinase
MKTNILKIGLLTAWILAGTISLVAENNAPVDRVTFKGGKVLVPQDGKLTEAIADTALANEVMVKTNGVFNVGKGKARQMREGQVIDAQGMLSSPDGTVVPVFDHIALRKGRVEIVTDGDAKTLSREYALPNGAKVLPDGTLRQGGSMKRLLDGQLLRLDGNVVASTDTVSLVGGKVVLYKDGGKTDLRRGQTMAMSDGTKVSGDGYVIRPDGTRSVLKEGETLKLPGVLSSRR